MSQQLKRMLSLALSVALCTSTLPASVIAEESLSPASDEEALVVGADVAQDDEGQPSATDEEPLITTLDGSQQDGNLQDANEQDEGLQIVAEDGQAPSKTADDQAIETQSEKSDATQGKGDEAIVESDAAESSAQSSAKKDADENTGESANADKGASESANADKDSDEDEGVTATNAKDATNAKGLTALASDESEVPSVTYQAYMRRLGKMSVLKDGRTSGTSISGSQVPMKAFRVKAPDLDGGIRYKALMSNGKWTGWRKNWKFAGNTSGSKTLKAIKISLTGKAKQTYDVYYRVYVRNIGWLGWTKNGRAAGTAGCTYQTGAFQVILTEKGADAPVSDDEATDQAFLGKATVSYSACFVNGSWQAARKNGKTAGRKKGSKFLQTFTASLSCSAKGKLLYSGASNGGDCAAWTKAGTVAGEEGKNLTSVRFKLTGSLRKYYNVWYRVYVNGKGWTGWAKNSAVAGSDASSCGIKALQVKVLSKSRKAPGSTSNVYYATKQLNGVDISGWEKGINTKKLTADFVIVKATEGVQGTIYNPGYKTMANDAYDSGKLIGFYHYANGGNAKKEARCFYNAIKSYKGKAIACLDWEGQGNKKFATGVDVKWCKTFLDELKRLYGGTPLLYTGKNETNDYNWSSVAQSYPLWGAEYAYANYIYQGYQSRPWQSTKTWGAWGTKALIHQYGYVNPKPNNGGISTGIDADLFYGVASDWNALLS